MMKSVCFKIRGTELHFAFINSLTGSGHMEENVKKKKSIWCPLFDKMSYNHLMFTLIQCKPYCYLPSTQWRHLQGNSKNCSSFR